MSVLTEFSTECIGDRYCVACQLHYPGDYIDDINTEDLGINLNGLSDRQKIFAVTSRVMELFIGMPLDVLENDDVIKLSAKRILASENVSTEIKFRDNNEIVICYDVMGRTVLTIELS